MTILLIILIASTFCLIAEDQDTLIFITPTVEVKDDYNSIGMERLLPVQKSAIYAGKKTETINLSKLNVNLAGNPTRQVFSKISGLNIWEGDSGGMQIAIGGRGLSPHRTSNFNTRQNGYDISADALGYPESYYTPPMEAVDRIEIVRGAASLQYGTQFGGFLNFKLKQAQQNAPFELVSRQTGSAFFNPENPMGNTFNSAQFSNGDFSYYAYFQFKGGQGWRDHSDFNQIGGHFDMLWSINDESSLRFEFTKMNYLTQQPGGMTDFEFEIDPRISHRARNWFQVDWNVLALVYDNDLSKNLHLNVRNFGVVAERNSLGILGKANRADIGGFRDLIRGSYVNFGNETRLLYKYELFDLPSALISGFRLYRGSTNQSQGQADSSSAPVFSFLDRDQADYLDFSYPGWNTSVFLENMFQITENLSVIPGIRFETISTNSQGTIQDVYEGSIPGDVIENSTQIINVDRNFTRSFLLTGIGFSYYANRGLELYTNISQNYRAINFNDMRIINPNQKIDLNLADETGWSLDFGLRGKYSNIIDYDLNLFALHYNDKIGELPSVDSNNITFRYRTNISDAMSYGLESFAEVDLMRLFDIQTDQNLNFFTNISIIQAQYVNSENPLVNGKNLESSPNLILRTGLNYNYKDLRISSNLSYLSQQFTDATNVEYDPNAIFGVIPSYYVLDLNISYKFTWAVITAGSENLSNNMYFTRRAAGYPGPGIIPSDGRNFYLNFNFNI